MSRATGLTDPPQCPRGSTSPEVSSDDEYVADAEVDSREAITGNSLPPPLCNCPSPSRSCTPATGPTSSKKSTRARNSATTAMPTSSLSNAASTFSSSRVPRPTSKPAGRGPLPRYKLACPPPSRPQPSAGWPRSALASPTDSATSTAIGRATRDCTRSTWVTTTCTATTATSSRRMCSGLPTGGTKHHPAMAEG